MILHVCMQLLSGIPETGNKQSMMMGRWNCQAIQTNMEKKTKSKNEMEVACGQ